MKQEKFLIITLWFTTISVLAIFILILVLSLPSVNGFDMDIETKSLLKLIVPIIAIYLTPITAYSIRNRYRLKGNPRVLNSQYIVFSWTVISLHLLLVIVLIVLKAVSQLKFESLMMLLPFVELAFGTYVNLIIAGIFRASKNQQATRI
jgi:hypothetical protein